MRFFVHAEDQHMGVGFAGEHATHRFDAARARQRQVHHDDVRAQCAETLVRLRGVGGFTGHAHVGTQFEQAPVTFAHHGVVIDQKDGLMLAMVICGSARSVTLRWLGS